MRRWLLVSLVLVLVVGPTVSAQDDGPRRADYFDVPYVPDGDSEQVSDIYLPTTGEAPHPAIVMYHGGSLLEGSRDGMRRTALLFADAGFVVFNMEYRTGADHIAPAQAFDALCGLGWIHAHADEYGVDVDRIFTWAESMGGFFAAMASYAPADPAWLVGCPWEVPDEEDRTAGMIAIAGVVSLWEVAQQPEDRMMWARSMGMITDEQIEARTADPNLPSDAESVFGDLVDLSSPSAALFDPPTYIDRNDPPALLIHHALDAAVPVSASQHFAQVALDEGGRATLVVFNDQYFYPYHGFWYADEPSRATAQTTLRYIFAFLEDNGAFRD